MSVMRGQCDARPTVTIGWYQIILLGDIGTCVLTTCPRLRRTFNSSAAWRFSSHSHHCPSGVHMLSGPMTSSRPSPTQPICTLMNIQLGPKNSATFYKVPPSQFLLCFSALTPSFFFNAASKIIRQKLLVNQLNHYAALLHRAVFVTQN